MVNFCINTRILLCFSNSLVIPSSRNRAREISTHFNKGNQESEYEVARNWFSTFKSSSIPTKLARTTFSRASGPGGQKTNKTSSKATTTWALSSLLSYLPDIIHEDISKSRYFVSSSRSILIQCDSHRSQSSNKDETHKKLFEEIVRIYQKKVPGITTPEHKRRIDQLKKAENTSRLRIKKQHSAKKSLRRKVFE